MAVMGSVVDQIKLKKKLQSEQGPTPAAKPPVSDTQIVSGGSMATANAIGGTSGSGLPTKGSSVKTPTAPSAKGVSKTPKLPVFGTKASQEQVKGENYLETRNTDLAKTYTTQGLKTKEDVYGELSKSKDFMGATETDKQNTATEIFNKMQQGSKVDVADIPQDTREYRTLSDAEMDNPWISTLPEVEKQAYAMMSDMEKKQFINIGRNDLKNTATYVARWKEQEDYQGKQGDIQKKQDAIQGEMADIQSGQRLRQASQQLSNLKQNIAYLGKMGSPGTSAAKMDAITGQLAQAETMYNELARLEGQQKELRKLGSEGLANQLERQMGLLQDDLDDKVKKAMQKTMLGLSAADIKGQLDTVEEIDQFRKNMVNSLDSEISGITDDNIKARSFLLERFDTIMQDQRQQIQLQQKAQADYQKQASTVNVDMSTAQGYYVDGNGNPIISAKTGQIIPMPAKPPIPPQYDAASGRLIIFKNDANGNIVANVQQVSTPQGKIETVTTTDEYGNEIKQSVMVYNDGSVVPVNMGGGKSMGSSTGATGDLRGLAANYPGQAWAKNNNPAGITWNANFDNPDRDPKSTAARLIDAGINFSKGTARPLGEGGNYVTFNTIEDGLAAQRIMMVGSYGDATVNNMLQKWVGTKEGPNYAKQVASMAGIDNMNVKVKDLSEEQVAALQMAKIKKESPGLYKLLNAPADQTAQNDKYSGILNTILASGSFTKDQKNTIRKGVLNGEDPVTVVKNQAKNIMSAPEKKDLGSMETAKQQIQSIQGLLKQYYDKGGSTNILKGGIEKVVNKLGTVKDPELVNIATQIASALQVYRNAVSGTAYSVQEGQEIASIFPGINKTEGLNKAVIDGRLAAFDATIDGMYRNVLGSTYDQIKSSSGTATTSGSTTGGSTTEAPKGTGGTGRWNKTKK